MPDHPSAAELRRSVAVLATEWWLVAGGLAGYLTFGAWVVTTGLALDALAPGLAATTLATIGPVTVTGVVALAAVAWLLAPALVAAWLLDRQLSNVNGNLVSQYRIDHPGVLPAPSGVLVLAATAAALVVGPRTPVLAVMALAGVHLLVRTIAFGRRVYSFSPKPLFTAMSLVSGLALGAAWLGHAPRLPGTAGEWVADAGVVAVVEAAGIGSASSLGVLVAVPALVSGLYLAVQTAVAVRVRSRAPLANPTKRAEQRYPIMPPVADSSRPGPPTPSEKPEPATTDPPSEPDTDEQTADASEPAETAEEPDDRSHTRVFTRDESVPDDEDAMAAVADATAEETDDDGWIDDTAIFSPDGATGSEDECGECGEEIPRESVTFCPNCGERVRR